MSAASNPVSLVPNAEVWTGCERPVSLPSRAAQLADFCEERLGAKWENKGNVTRLFSHGLEHIVVTVERP